MRGRGFRIVGTGEHTDPVGTLPGTDRDEELILDQIRRAVATLEAGDPAWQYVEGIAETLMWAAGRMLEAPGTREPRPATRFALETELAVVGIHAHDRQSPAHRYALGSLRTLEWLLGKSDRLPVAWPEPGTAATAAS